MYNFDHATEFKTLPAPCQEFTQKFLELVHYDQGGRIFTYVLTLDALFRFTETGKEFGIDMLSKHTMHSDVAAYVAFSGEFFIRRLKHKDRKPIQSRSLRISYRIAMPWFGCPTARSTSTCSRSSPATIRSTNSSSTTTQAPTALTPNSFPSSKNSCLKTFPVYTYVHSTAKATPRRWNT